MNVTICEHGCGRTSLDNDAAIEVVSVRMRVNGNEESSFEGRCEVCRHCRALIHNTLTGLFIPRQLLVQVRDQSEAVLAMPDKYKM